MDRWRARSVSPAHEHAPCAAATVARPAAPSEDVGVLADELLDALHRKIGGTQPTYAEPPVRFEGGYFTENHGFRLAGAPPPWDGPLVVRLFPSTSPSDLPRREAAVQRVLSDQGYPAPPVVLFDDEARLVGRRFFVMARLPGRPLLGGIRVRELAKSGLRVFTRLTDMTASMQAWMHRLDAKPLLTQLGDTPAGIERWLDLIGAQAQTEFDGLSEGLQWLIDHRPPESARRSICHGDLWGGNILAEGNRVTGVLDYTVATVAEPALDVGFTAMSLCLAPIDASRPIQRAAARNWSVAVQAIRPRLPARGGHRPLEPALLRSIALRERADGRGRLPDRRDQTATTRRTPADVGLDLRPDDQLLPRPDRCHARTSRPGRRAVTAYEVGRGSASWINLMVSSLTGSGAQP